MTGQTEISSGLTQETLRRKLGYDPETGVFKRRSSDGSWRIAGYVTKPKGYIEIRLDGFRFMAHRLAWLYMTGAWPTETIDHADLDTGNNRFSNLREATLSQNLANRRRRRFRKHDLPKGVVAFGTRYRAQIYVNKKRIYLGTFSSAELAATAYIDAAMASFGDFARSG